MKWEKRGIKGSFFLVSARQGRDDLKNERGKNRSAKTEMCHQVFFFVLFFLLLAKSFTMTPDPVWKGRGE